MADAELDPDKPDATPTRTDDAGKPETDVGKPGTVAAASEQPTAPPTAEPGSAEPPTAESPTPETGSAEPPTAEPGSAEPPTAESPTPEPGAAEPPTAESPAAESAVTAPETESRREPVSASTPIVERITENRRTLLAAAMAVALVAVCVVGGLVIARGKSNAEQTEQAAVVVDVAGKVATDLASISANNAAQQLTVLTAETTGQFHEQIAPYAAALQSTLAQAGANSKAQLTASGLESFADDHATVLVALSATVGNSASPNVETVPYRLAIGLRKVNNRWLADEVSFIK